MRKILLIICCLASVSAFAQNSSNAKLKQYLGVLTLVEKYKDEKNWSQADQGIVGQHFQRLVKFKNEGIVVLAGRTHYDLNNPDMMGLVIFNAKDDAAAQQFMMEDPAVKNNIMLAKIHPYDIAVKKCD